MLDQTNPDSNPLPTEEDNHPHMQSKEKPSWLSLLKNRNFRLLWLGEGISVLGDQFYMIALPWLVLQLTGDAFAMGMVLALASIPRALFLLLGGAVTDRLSPRVIMLGSNILRMFLVGLLALLVLSGAIQLWMLYMLALAFGVIDAFFFPASGAIVPQLVEKDDLQAGNSLIHGTVQLSIFLGPVLAGGLIALLASSPTSLSPVEAAVPGLTGIGLAFGFDAATFLISAITLWLIKAGRMEEGHQEGNQQDSVFRSIGRGLVSVWHDQTLRVLFFIIAAINLLINGPLIVGIPVLADARFPEGAAAFGMLMSAFGGGALMGTVLAGVLPKPNAGRMGAIMLTTVSVLGIGLALLGFVWSTALAAGITLMMGVANGYVGILFITWLQSRTPQKMLGRMMSLLMFASIGLNPISMALSGALIEANTLAMFVVSGSIITAITLAAAMNPAVRAMGLREQVGVAAPLEANLVQEM